MADPRRLDVRTTAADSTRSLYETIERCKRNDRNLTRLRAGVEKLVHALDSLAEVKNSHEPFLILLEGPVKLCSQVCYEFERAIIDVSETSKMDLYDWTKVKFIRGDINESIDTIAWYTSTISIGLSITTLHASKVSHQDLEECTELIKDTEYDLKLHLQLMNEQKTQSTVENTNASAISVEDEIEVVEQSLRVCEYATAYIERLSNAEQKPSQCDPEEDSLEVQLRPRQGLQESRVGFAETIGGPRKSLELTVTQENTEREDDISRLQSDINGLEQRLDDCRATSMIRGLEVYKAGEVIADGCDQISVTTLDDMNKASRTPMTRRVIASGGSTQVVVNSRPGYFDIGKAESTGTSAQLVASTTGDLFSELVNKHYS